MACEKPPTAADWAIAYLQDVAHVFRRGSHYEYDGRCYQKIEDQLMLRTISHFICSIDPALATACFVKEVAETISQMVAISSIPVEPLWLDGSPAGNAIAIENGVLQLDQFIEEQLRESALLPAPQSRSI